VTHFNEISIRQVEFLQQSGVSRIFVQALQEWVHFRLDQIVSMRSGSSVQPLKGFVAFTPKVTEPMTVSKVVLCAYAARRASLNPPVSGLAHNAQRGGVSLPLHFAAQKSRRENPLWFSLHPDPARFPLSLFGLRLESAPRRCVANSPSDKPL